MSTYSVASLWRYPVKSMAGEELLDSVDVTARGLRGDRAYALVDTAHGKVGSAKSVRKFGDLLKCHAQFVSPPGSDDRMPAVQITLPDGSVADSGQPDRDAKLNAAFGPQVSLVSAAPDGLMLEVAAGTLGGKHAETTALPVGQRSAFRNTVRLRERPHHHDGDAPTPEGSVSRRPDHHSAIPAQHRRGLSGRDGIRGELLARPHADPRIRTRAARLHPVAGLGVGGYRSASASGYRSASASGCWSAWASAAEDRIRAR